MSYALRHRNRLACFSPPLESVFLFQKVVVKGEVGVAHLLDLFKSLMVRALCWKVRVEFKEGPEFFVNSIFGKLQPQLCEKQGLNCLPWKEAFTQLFACSRKGFCCGVFLILSKSHFFYRKDSHLLGKSL